MEKECEALLGVAYPGVRDNRSTINTKTGYDDFLKINFLSLIVMSGSVVELGLLGGGRSLTGRQTDWWRRRTVQWW